MRGKTMTAIVSAVLLALLILGGGCSRRDGASKELAALENAYRAGVLNKEEYEMKRAALANRSRVLAALDEARDAGLLTQDEYLAKRSAMLALAPAGAHGPDMQPFGSAGPVAGSERDSGAPTPAGAHEGQPPATGPLRTPSAARATAAIDGAQEHMFRMKMIKATDAQGFERPMTSAVMLVPVDWQSQGGTAWNIKDKCNSIQTTLRASGPDGRGVEVFPAFNWAWADDTQAARMTAAQTAKMGMRPCDLMPPMGAADYLRRNLGKLRPDAQLVGIEPAPKLMDILQQQARQTEQSAAKYRLQQRVRPDAAKGRVKYNLNGQAMEEWVIVATIATGTLGQSYDTRSMQLRPAWTYSCTAYVTAERAPQGRLEASEKLFELIVSTYRVGQEWQARVTQNALQLQQIELKGIRDRSAIVSKNADDIANIRRQQYENQQKSEDHISAQYSEYQRGVETYRNPSTGETVELSNQYGNAWVNNRGEYLLSDQASFDPSVVLKEDWKPLEHVKK